MTITERVMGRGDWSIRLAESTPPSVLADISTPFGTIVVTPNRLNPSVVPDGSILASALFAGVVLRPGPQLNLGGESLAWFLSDGPGISEAGFTFSAASNSSAVSTLLSGTAFTSGSVSNVNSYTASHGIITRKTVLNLLAANSGLEWRINPSRTVDLASVTTLYGSTPTGVIVRRDGGREVATPQGITGRVSSTWDWSTYGSKAIVWSKQGSGTSGGASSYRDPAGTAMTIVRGFSEPDAPTSSEATIAAWWLGQINRTVRTVDITTEDYGVTGSVPCGGQVYLFDPDQGLYDPSVQVPYQGQMIAPVSARIVSVTWPVKRGMGVYHRLHDGTTATYVDLSDFVEWESGDTRYEVSTAQQALAPPTSSPGLDTFFSPWASYTPTWRASIADPAIGNGAIAGRFRRLGTTAEVNVTITMGSTTTFGTGSWFVTLPPGCTGRTVTNGYQTKGAVLAIDTGVNSYPCDPYVISAGTNIQLVYGSPWAAVTATAPFTWGNGDVLTIDMSLELAP